MNRKNTKKSKIKLLNYVKKPKKILGALNSMGLLKFLTDEQCIKMLFNVRLDQKPNLENPKTFNEKLNWLKLHNRNPEYSIMVDKYKSKEYITEKIGEGHVVPLLGVWDRPEDVNFDALPDKFVIKCNHNSGTGMYICDDKSKLNVKKVRKNLKKGLKSNYYYFSREWPYKNVERKIIAEQFLIDDENDALTDYKFLCFNGEPKICYIGKDNSNKPTSDFFDIDFNKLDIRMKDPNSEIPPEKPECFEEMVKYATILSKDIPFVRVDFYYVNKVVYVGELTFFHNGGFTKMTPPEWDEKLGKLIKLPIDKVENKD